MANNEADYFGLNRVLSIILAIIPITSWICGVITRFEEGKYVAGIIRIFFGFTIIWILDLVFMIARGEICKVLDI